MLFISLTANNGQVSEQGYTKSELQEAAYKLYKEIGLAYEEDAEVQDVSVEAVRQRVMRSERFARPAQKAIIRIIKVFSGTPAANGSRQSCECRAQMSCDAYRELCETIRKKSESNCHARRQQREDGERSGVRSAHQRGRKRPDELLVLFSSKKWGQTPVPHGTRQIAS